MRWLIGAVLTLGVLSGAVSGARAAEPSVESLSAAADTLLEGLKAEAATQAQQSTAEALADGSTLTPAERAVAAAPGSSAALGRLALERYRASRFADAKALAARGFLLSPTARAQAGGLVLIAESLVAEGDTAQALAFYRRAIRLDAANRTYQRRLAALSERFDFRLTEVAVDVERTLATACAVFSKDLARPLPLKPQDYVTLSPKADVDVYAASNRLCVRGLVHGKAYDLTVRAGVPAAGGGRLAAAQKRRIEVADRAERIALGVGRYVLPRAGEALLPLKTVNVSRVKLSLYQVAERSLVLAAATGRMERPLSGYGADEIEAELGRKLWTGEMAVDLKRNREMTTLVPLQEMIGKRPYGLYVLMAEDARAGDDQRWEERQTQWLIVSDLGLASLSGQDGLTVQVRSLASAAPRSGVRLELIARNNEVLGVASTNSAGIARFTAGLSRGTGGQAPAFVIAKIGTDMNLLRLNTAALDLTERGVEGRAAPRTPVDAFLYTDRGVYRPAEAVQLSLLARNGGARAVARLPLMLIVRRPDGSEMTRLRARTDALGAIHTRIALPGGARTGEWTVSAQMDAAGAPIGQVTFQVEDFVPQRIEVSAKGPVGALARGQAMTATLDGRYYYGPPAAGLTGEATLDIVVNDTPFDAFKGWTFGRVEESFAPIAQAPVRFVTDAAGRARVTIDPGEVPDTSKPLVARLGLTLFDVGGRPVYAQVRSPLALRPVEIGLKSRFGDSVGAGDAASFDVVALTPAGAGVPRRMLAWQWVREDYDYSWYEDGGQWYSRTNVVDSVAAAGRSATDARGRLVLTRPLASGRWRLDVADVDGSAVSSQRFWAGWWSSGVTANAPDALEVSLKSADLRDGGSLSAFVRAPFDGLATAMIVSDRVHWSATVPLSGKGTTITAPVRAAYGPGAYLMVTGYRPKAAEPSPLPVRAMGLAWFGIDTARRTLAVNLTVPSNVRPRQQVTVPLSITGARPGEAVGVSIAAVDEGILALTRFVSPKPEAHFLGKRQLGMDVHDLYGQIIQPDRGQRGKLRQGGDAAGSNARGNLTRTVKTVALFTTQVKLDAAGKGTVSLTLPDFNGRLRLMAVAYDAAAVGSGEAALTVRDPVVAELILPRFLAPGDQARAMLSVHNTTATRQLLSLNLAAPPGMTLAGVPAGAIALKPGERREIPVPITAGIAGERKLALAASGGFGRMERSWDIAVRHAQPIITRRTMEILNPGASATFGAAERQGLAAGTVRASLTLAARPDFDVPALLDALSQYPYGCTEQTLSGLLPLLYFADVAKAWNARADSNALQGRIERAISKLFERQDGSGGLGLWSASGGADLWLSAYAHDVLSRAQAKGFAVPRAGFDALTSYLDDMRSRDWDTTLEGRAYALYTLARAGKASASDVRYFAEQEAPKLRSRLAVGQVAAALAAVGEKVRAERLFGVAARTARSFDGAVPDYGSTVRDGAALIALYAEAGLGADRILRASEALEMQVRAQGSGWLSTQDQAWLLVATHALGTLGGDVQAQVGGKAYGPTPQPLYRPVSAVELGQSLSIRNTGQRPLRLIRTVRGVPVQPLAAGSSGFAIARTITSVSGGPVNLASVRQNDRLVITITGRAQVPAIRHAMVADLLPAGFEIETASLGGQAAERDEDGAGNRVYRDARDDRMVAAFDLENQRAFTLRYTVRAVTPGRFTLPGAFVEDMYQPRYNARTATGQVAITATSGRTVPQNK